MYGLLCGVLPVNYRITSGALRTPPLSTQLHLPCPLSVPHAWSAAEEIISALSKGPECSDVVNESI